MQQNVINSTATGEVTQISVRKLEECLRSELAAVETYELALKGIDHVDIHRALQELLTSHANRLDMLRDRLVRMGVEIPSSSGAWGAFAKAVQRGADLLGDRVAISALEQGEDHGLDLYSRGLDDCDWEIRTFILTQLLPEQRRTHDLCSSLKSYVMNPS